MNSLPLLARWLLRRCLSADARDRAEADLQDLHAGVKGTRGGGAASRVVLREALLIVGWAAYDRMRRLADRGAAADSPRRRPMYRDLLLDIRVGLRGLARRPGFAFVTMGVLALGIGATTSIFTLANRLFLQPPPLVQDDGRLVRLFRSSNAGYGSTLGYPDYLDYRQGSRAIASLAAWSSPIGVAARLGEGSRQLAVGLVTENYFEMLGIRPLAGRFFHPDENRTPEGHPVAVISWSLWQGALAGVAEPVGRTVTLNDRTFTIVGVAPREFRGVTPGEAARDLWIPIMMLPVVSSQGDDAWRVRLPDNRSNWLFAVGRLAEGATEAQAQAELATVAAGIYGGANEESVLATHRYRWYPDTFASLSRLTTLLMGAVLVLLVVAGANVTIMLLARATSRAREIGIRAALGAGRGRVVRQLLAESLIIGLGGGLIGVALSLGAARVVGALLPVALEFSAMPEPLVLGFALVLATVTAGVVGTAPAWHAASGDVAGVIHGRTNLTGGGALRDGLVVFQVALSLMLVTGAALFARSLNAARGVELGFDTQNALLVSLNLGNRGYDAAHGRRFVTDAQEQLGRLPGVTAVTVTSVVPFRGEWSGDLTVWAGHRFVGGAEAITVGRNAVPPGYFETMGIRLIAGRDIAAADAEGAPRVVVVNETFARTVFPEGNPVGQLVPLGGPDGPPFTIVGVVKDATYYEFGESPQAFVYVPLTQAWLGQLALVVRTGGDPLTLAPAVQRAIQTLDPSLPFTSIETLEAVYQEQLAGYRTTANVVGLAGIIALLLAAAGLFGVMAYRVTQQTREIGIRMALGASRALVARSVMGRGLRLVGIGLSVGVVGSLGLGRFIEGFLYAVPSRDPVSLLAAPVVLLAVAIGAILVPTRRAMRIDPMGAIRTE